MQKAGNIPVSADPEPYRQSRSRAIGHATTVPGRVRDSFRPSLQILPHAAKKPCFPGSHPQFAAARIRRQHPQKTSTQTGTNSPRKPECAPKNPSSIPVKPI